MRNKFLFAGAAVKPADPEDALEFIRGLKETGREGNLELTEEAVRQYVSQFPLGELQAIARRIMMDIMKGPQRELIHLEEKEAEAAERPARAAPKRASAPRSDKRITATRRDRRSQPDKP